MKGRVKNKNLILQIHWVNLNKLLLKATLGFEEAHFFSRGENTEIAKIFLSIINWAYFNGNGSIRPDLWFAPACKAPNLFHAGMP